MKRTRAELAAHLMKAARGAGLPLALAEDLYQMAGFVTTEDVAWLADDIARGGAGLLDLTVMLDQLDCGELHNVTEPLAQAMAAARGWVLIHGRKHDQIAPPASTAIEIPQALWSALDRFAARTYVPESSLSRARGAGAGRIDND